MLASHVHPIRAKYTRTNTLTVIDIAVYIAVTPKTGPINIKKINILKIISQHFVHPLIIY